MYGRRSPKASAWPTSGWATSMFSITAGGTFSPPAVIIEFLLAVHHRQEAVLIEAPDVPGVQPAVSVDRGGGHIWPVQVAGGEEGPAHQDLAVLGDLDFHSRERPPDGPDLELRRRVLANAPVVSVIP